MGNRIPEVFQAKIAAFLASGATGSIVLHAHQGSIKACDITECLRINNAGEQGTIEKKQRMAIKVLESKSR